MKGGKESSHNRTEKSGGGIKDVLYSLLFYSFWKAADRRGMWHGVGVYLLNTYFYLLLSNMDQSKSGFCFLSAYATAVYHYSWMGWVREKKRAVIITVPLLTAMLLLHIEFSGGSRIYDPWFVCSINTHALAISSGIGLQDGVVVPEMRQTSNRPKLIYGKFSYDNKK